MRCASSVVVLGCQKKSKDLSALSEAQTATAKQLQEFLDLFSDVPDEL
jgi:hypothetical protein